MTQHIYKVRTVDQLRVYERELRAGIATILKDTRVVEKTVDEIWRELPEFLGEEEGLWVVLEEGALVAWLAAKCYLDADRKTACICWAHSNPRSKSNDGVMAACEEWARSRGAFAIYAARRLTRLRSFMRRMKHYGYRFEAIVVVKDFREVDQPSVDVDLGEVVKSA